MLEEERVQRLRIVFLLACWKRISLVTGNEAEARSLLAPDLICTSAVWHKNGGI
jgi:hypothetical protein